MTKVELTERLLTLAQCAFFDKGYLQQGLEAYALLGIDPPARLFVRCGCALWREEKYLEAAQAFVLAPPELSADHLDACRTECLAQRRVLEAVEIARMQGVSIADELLACASAWRKQGRIAESVAAYRAAGMAIPHSEFRSTGTMFLFQGALGVALDAFDAAGADLPLENLQRWLSNGTSGTCNPWLELRVLTALWRSLKE